MTKIFEADPNGGLASFEQMMRKQIVMPAVLMEKGNPNKNIFSDFSAITQKIGVYTTYDYASIIDHLVKLWKIDSLTGLNAGMAKAQDYLCNLADRYKRIADRMKVPNEVSLAWLPAK